MKSLNYAESWSVNCPKESSGDISQIHTIVYSIKKIRCCFSVKTWHCVVPENINTPPPIPPEIPIEFHTFPLKTLASATTLPLRLISLDLLWGGGMNIFYNYTLFLHFEGHFFAILLVVNSLTEWKQLDRTPLMFVTKWKRKCSLMFAVHIP